MAEPGRDHLSDEDLQSYLDGELGEAPARWASAHLEMCADCRERAGTLEGVIEALSRLSDVPWQGDLAPGVLNRIHSAAAPRRRWPWLVGAQGLAAAALAVWAGQATAAEWVGYAAGRLQAPPAWLLEVLAWARTAGEAVWGEAAAWVEFTAQSLASVPAAPWAVSLSASPTLLAGLLVLWLAGNSLLLIPKSGRAGRAL